MSVPPAKNVFGHGSAESDLTLPELGAIVAEALAQVPASARVLAILSDKTRDDNTPDLFPIAAAILADRGVSKLDALIAQGTHSAMTGAEKLDKIGAASFSDVPLLQNVFDHQWNRPEELVTIGELGTEEVRDLTGGLFDRPIPLQINKLLAPGNYDVVLIFGATVPHEVAGFAGGAKYFFPGVAGPELTHATHWLAALATIENTIGRIETPTRRMIEAAADRITADVIAFVSVVSRTDDERLRTHALFAGDYRLALRQAAAVSRLVHIKYIGRKYRRVVALLDPHYDDLWVGGKASYRLGGVIEEGGELIVYAPHLRCISETHGELIERFGGYAPLQKVKDLIANSGELEANLCVAAHLTHVAYAGRTDESGDLVLRYRITLASQVDEATCERVNLGYLNPNDFHRSDYEGDPDTLIVDRAGRDLYLVEPRDD